MVIIKHCLVPETVEMVFLFIEIEEAVFFLPLETVTVRWSFFEKYRVGQELSGESSPIGELLVGVGQLGKISLVSVCGVIVTA